MKTNYHLYSRFTVISVFWLKSSRKISCSQNTNKCQHTQTLGKWLNLISPMHFNSSFPSYCLSYDWSPPGRAVSCSVEATDIWPLNTDSYSTCICGYYPSRIQKSSQYNQTQVVIFRTLIFGIRQTLKIVNIWSYKSLPFYFIIFLQTHFTTRGAPWRQINITSLSDFMEDSSF